MKNTSLTCITSALLWMALSSGCGPSEGHGTEPDTLDSHETELVGNGYKVYYWGTRTDMTGTNIGAMSSRTCFLSGVAGNLSVGGEWYEDVESVAKVDAQYPSDGNYWLVAHGGAYTNQVNQTVWQNNPVLARATCFWTTTNRKAAAWSSYSYGISRPVKVADLDPNNRRICFLSGLWGVGGAWGSSDKFARVIKRPDGWYIESNLVSWYDGSHARVEARCVDFPRGTVFSSGSVSAAAGTTVTQPITSLPGTMHACALTGIQGALNQNSWTDGALINWPSVADGTWTITVQNGKTASYACVR
jgi:hypothetical protein